MGRLSLAPTQPQMNTSTLKAAESPIIKNRAQLILQSKALTMVDSGIMITDHRGRIIWVNPAFSKSTGYPVEEIVGKTPTMFKSGRHDPSFYREFWDTILRGETWRGQFINRRRDGSLCLHAQTVTPIRWHSNGPVTHFISVCKDITDGKKGEVKSSEPRNRDADGQLAAGVARHFNDLLTVIHSNSVLLLQFNGDLNPECRSLVERTLVASREAADLIRQRDGDWQNQALKFQGLDLNPIVQLELPGLSEQPLRPRQMELKTDAKAATPNDPDDAIVWVSAAFSAGDMVAHREELAEVAPLDMDKLIHDRVKTLRRLLNGNIEVR